MSFEYRKETLFFKTYTTVSLFGFEDFFHHLSLTKLLVVKLHHNKINTHNLKHSISIPYFFEFASSICKKTKLDLLLKEFDFNSSHIIYIKFDFE
jgi:hypothetical protein